MFFTMCLVQKIEKWNDEKINIYFFCLLRKKKKKVDEKCNISKFTIMPPNTLELVKE